MYQPEMPYDPGNCEPQLIRDDFWDLTRSEGYDPDDILDRLANFLPTDTLKDFMNDLAMGRV
jgi:hypothetical protein